MARNEKLIVRHPAPKVEDDRYMLDRWTPEVTHKTRQVYRVELRPAGPTASIDAKSRTWYRTECLCGWRSVEGPRPTPRELPLKCPVLMALEVRARSLKKDSERIEWIEYHSPVNNAEGTQQ